MIKTQNNKIVNINKGSILGDKYELLLRSNKETRLSGSNVQWWSDKKNGWFFKGVSGKYPTLNDGIEFTASDQYLISNKTLDLTKPFTMSLWYKFDTYGSSNQYVFSQWKSTDSNNYFVLRHQNTINYFSVELKSGGILMTIRSTGQNDIGINDTDWHHFLWCSDGVNITQYIDGKMIYVGYHNSLSENPYPLALGALWQSLQCMDGKIEDIQILPYCPEKLVGWTGSALKYDILSNEQVFQPPQRQSYDTTPILQLQANVLSRQGILLDASNKVLQWNDVRNKHFAISISGKEPLYDYSKNAIKYDYTNSEFLKINDSGNVFNIDSGWLSISFYYYRIGNLTGTCGILSKKSDTGITNNVWLLYHSANNLLFRVYNSTSYAGISTGNVSDSAWHHVLAMAYTSGSTTTIYLFLDGVYIGTSSLTNVNIITKPICIGGFLDAGENTVNSPFDGYIDGIKVLRKQAVGISGISIGQQVFIPQPRNFPQLNS